MDTIGEAEIATHSKFPRITPPDLDAKIKSVAFDYHDLTVKCCITMQNGFSVHGESGCAVPGNYRRETGERLAYNDAKNKMWSLLGYELKSKVALAQSLGAPQKIGESKVYVGTKALHARPLLLGAYNEFRGWATPSNEDPEAAGYLVEYPDGYVSWSPKDVFEASYEEMDVNGEGAIGGLTWRDRVEIEKDQLLDRLDKLTTLLAGPKPDGMPEYQWRLLNEQVVVMSSYLSLLKLRLGEG